MGAVHHVVACFLLILEVCLPFKCPPAPESFEDFDSPLLHNLEPVHTCDEIDSFRSKRTLSKYFACKETNHSCKWDVVNLGLEKTGTSEIANLLRLLQIQNLTFASPRGAASGLKVLESCACDPNVRYVLTTRNLLDMIVSRMSYHHWTCEENKSTQSHAASRFNKSSNSFTDLKNKGGDMIVRCGGMDPACCWRKNPLDMIQSWAFCRDAYHLNIVDILTRTNALDRLLILNIALEGEHHVYHRLKSFVSEKHDFLEVVEMEKSNEDNSSQQLSMIDVRNGSSSSKNKEYKVGKNGVVKPIKLLRRKTNKQAYPDGLKPCLKEYARDILKKEPLKIESEQKLNHPLLSLDISLVAHEFAPIDEATPYNHIEKDDGDSLPKIAQNRGKDDDLSMGIGAKEKLLELGTIAWSSISNISFE